MEPGGLIVLVAVFALFWVLFIMPQRKRLHAQRETVESVGEGDEILTVGGLIGRVRSVAADGELRVEIAPGTEVRVARRAVAAILTPADEPPKPEQSEPREDVPR